MKVLAETRDLRVIEPVTEIIDSYPEYSRMRDLPDPGRSRRKSQCGFEVSPSAYSFIDDSSGMLIRPEDRLMLYVGLSHREWDS